MKDYTRLNDNDLANAMFEAMRANFIDSKERAALKDAFRDRFP